MRTLVCAVALALACPAQEIDEAIAKEIEKSVPKDFWGVVLVAKDGQPLLHKAYGMADYASVPNTVDTYFEIASTSKTITAAAILKLEMQGKLKLSTTIGELFKNASADLKPVTVQNLVNHTSGLVYDDCIIGYGDPRSRDAYLEFFLKAKRERGPGERWEYNNGCYSFLALIVEVVSGEPFEDYVRKNLFLPAGMTSTGFVNEKALEGKPAASRKLVREGGRMDGTASKWLYGWGYRGMGGVVTTAEDMLRWDRALRGDGLFDEATKKKMYTVAMENYACGWRVADSPLGKVIEHGGSVGGFMTGFARYMDKDVTVIVLTNEGYDIYTVVADLARAAFDVKDPPDSGVGLAIKLEGVKKVPAAGYEVPKGSTWRIGRESSGAVVIEIREGEKVRARVTVPEEGAKSLVAKLDELVARKGKDGLKDTTIASGFFTAGKAELSADRGLRLLVKEQLDADPRIALVVAVNKTGEQPLVVRLGAAKAKALAADVKKATGK